MSTPKVRPPRWYETGQEPDYRFSLANERTFLAWIRTSLGLLAGSVAVHQLATGLSSDAVRRLLAVVLATTGLLLSAAAYQRWMDAERAMRHDRPLRMPVFLLPALAAAVSVVAVLVAVAVAL